MRALAVVALLALAGCAHVVIPASLVAGAAVAASIAGATLATVTVVDMVKKDAEASPPSIAEPLPSPPPKKPKHHHKAPVIHVTAHSGEGGNGCCGASFGAKFPELVTLAPLPTIMLLDGRTEAPDRPIGDLAMARPLDEEPKLALTCEKGCTSVEKTPDGFVSYETYLAQERALEERHRRWVVYQVVGLAAAMAVGFAAGLLVRRNGA